MTPTIMKQTKVELVLQLVNVPGPILNNFATSNASGNFKANSVDSMFKAGHSTIGSPSEQSVAQHTNLLPLPAFIWQSHYTHPRSWRCRRWLCDAWECSMKSTIVSKTLSGLSVLLLVDPSVSVYFPC